MPVAWPDEVPVAGIDASHRGPAPHDAAGAAEQQRRRPEFAALLGMNSAARYRQCAPVSLPVSVSVSVSVSLLVSR